MNASVYGRIDEWIDGWMGESINESVGESLKISPLRNLSKQIRYNQVIPTDFLNSMKTIPERDSS